MERRVAVILDNIRSVYNVGSIFRTADAAGVEAIFLVGVTPLPVDRFGRDRKDLSKVSLGAEKSVPWRHFSEINEALTHARGLGFTIVAVEQDEDSINYKTMKPEGDLCFIFGEETTGISKETISKSDVVLEIPMKGAKESLNVAVTAGIILFS